MVLTNFFFTSDVSIEMCSNLTILRSSFQRLSFSLVVVEGLTIICRRLNLHGKSSYKIYVVITNIIIYDRQFKINIKTDRNKKNNLNN